MSIVTKDGVTVRVGQVWRDMDKRAHRTVTVEAVEEATGKAVVRATADRDGTVSKQVSRVSISRMHAHGQGFTLINEPQP